MTEQSILNSDAYQKAIRLLAQVIDIAEAHYPASEHLCGPDELCDGACSDTYFDGETLDEARALVRLATGKQAQQIAHHARVAS
jgi:hypothetical protein